MSAQNIDQSCLDAIAKELKWQSEWYTKNRSAGFDRASDAHWHTIKGMQSVLSMLGYEAECNPDDMTWTITAR